MRRDCFENFADATADKRSFGFSLWQNMNLFQAKGIIYGVVVVKN